MVFRVIFCSLMLHMAFSCLRFTASLDALSFGASSLEVGILLSLISLGPTFLAVHCGKWIDLVGVRRPVLSGASTILAASLLAWLLPPGSFGLVPLYLACAVIGPGFMCTQMVSQKIVGHLADPKNRTTAFSWFAMSMSFSGLFSPIVSGYVIDHVGHQSAFALASAFAAIGLAMFALNLKGLPESVSAKKKAAVKGTFGLLAIARVRNVLIVSAIVSMAWDLQHIMFPIFGHSIGLSASETGWLVGSFFTATFVVRSMVSVISRFFSEWQFLVLTLVVGCIAYAMFPFVTDFRALMGVAFILGLGLGASLPNVMSLLHSQSPQGRVGEAIGIRTMFTNGCHAVLPTFFGAITAVVGAGSIFLSMAVIMGGVAFWAKFLRSENHEIGTEEGR